LLDDHDLCTLGFVVDQQAGPRQTRRREAGNAADVLGFVVALTEQLPFDRQWVLCGRCGRPTEQQCSGSQNLAGMAETTAAATGWRVHVISSVERLAYGTSA